MEFIGTAILIVGLLALTVAALCVMLIVVGMCLPLLGIHWLPGDADYDEGKRWLR